MNNHPVAAFQQHLHEAKQELAAHVNQHFNGLAAQHRQRLQEVDKRLHDVATIMASMKMDREQDDLLVRIEDIPGRRVPFEYYVDIPIQNNDTSQREQSFIVSQEGPFVAVRRYAVFQSLFQYQVTTGANAPTKYVGRSYGRWRPISSVLDINDSQSPGAGVQTQNPFTNGAFIGAPELTSSQSQFRTMEFDGRISVVDAGSGFVRQNISTPSAAWMDAAGGPVDLAALDFFERGSVVTFQVAPNHVNNPQAGNADGLNIFGVAGWPFLAGQYDKHEGIITPSAFSVSGSPSAISRLATESVTRLPDGVMTIGYVGYRIFQPPGVG